MKIENVLWPLGGHAWIKEWDNIYTIEVPLTQNKQRHKAFLGGLNKNNEESILKALFPQGMLASFPMNQKRWHLFAYVTQHWVRSCIIHFSKQSNQG